MKCDSICDYAIFYNKRLLPLLVEIDVSTITLDGHTTGGLLLDYDKYASVHLLDCEVGCDEKVRLVLVLKALVNNYNTCPDCKRTGAGRSYCTRCDAIKAFWKKFKCGTILKECTGKYYAID